MRIELKKLYNDKEGITYEYRIFDDDELMKKGETYKGSLLANSPDGEMLIKESILKSYNYKSASIITVITCPQCGKTYSLFSQMEESSGFSICKCGFIGTIYCGFSISESI